MPTTFKLFKSTLKGARMLFSSYKAQCMSLLQKYFCTANFDAVVEHLNYMAEYQVDDRGYVTGDLTASLEIRMINNLKD